MGEAQKPTRRANIISKETTQKQIQDHKPINKTNSQNSDAIQTPVTNTQDKRKITEENATPVKQKLSHNTETIQI